MYARWKVKFAKTERRSSVPTRRSRLAKGRMDRVEREMARTERIVNDLVRQPVSLPSVVRRTEQNLARVKKNLARISESHTEINRKLNRLRRYVAWEHSLLRLAKANAGRKA